MKIHQCPYHFFNKQGTSFCAMPGTAGEAIAQINTEELQSLRKIVGVIQDPLRSVGSPCVADTGVPTYALVDRFLGGDSIADLASDYHISQEQIEIALRYELGSELSGKRILSSELFGGKLPSENVTPETSRQGKGAANE